VDVLDDHDGAVTAMAGDEEKLVTGSSDLTVKVKNKLFPKPFRPSTLL
jgi:hypothetical protein